MDLPRHGEHRQRWMILSIVAFLFFLANFAEFQLAGLAGTLSAALHLSPMQFAMCLFAPFLINFAFGIPIGMIADRFGTRAVGNVLLLVRLHRERGTRRRLRGGDRTAVCLDDRRVHAQSKGVSPVAAGLVGLPLGLSNALGGFFVPMILRKARTVRVSLALFVAVGAILLVAALVVPFGPLTWLCIFAGGIVSLLQTAGGFFIPTFAIALIARLSQCSWGLPADGAANGSVESAQMVAQ